MGEKPYNTPVSLHRDAEIGLITVDNPPVNALSHAVREGIWKVLDEARADDDIEAIVLRCAGRTFIAGADIREFGRPPASPWLPELLQKLDEFPKLSVAAIHGTALGGGLETALACHYRVMDSNARVGLPESQLGLLPGAGGTQRLPRLTGARAALDLMISGKPVDAARALELGIVDEIVEHGSLDARAIAFARAKLQAGARLRRASEQPVEQVPAGFIAEYRAGLGRRQRGFEAPGRIIDAVEAALTKPFAEGMQIEREQFVAAMKSTQSAAMRHLFFAERAAAKVPGIDKSVQPRAVQSVGVIGAGTMGSGIALACIARGLEVTLLDVNRDGLERGLATIDKQLAAQLGKGRIDERAANQQRERLTGATDYAALAGADLVIEAVFETMAIKEQVFGKLDEVCKPGAILATNTSTLDVDRIAAATARPEDVIGLHFFSPANIMRLLEIVRGEQTSDEVIASALAFAKAIGKIGVVVGNCFGFVGNRMLYGYGRENQFLLLEGAAPEYIDKVLTDFGMAMGPNAVGDLAGLDVGAKVRDERTDLPDDPRYYRVADLLVEQGRYGQKTGAGMFRYDAGSRAPIPDPEVQAMIEAEAQRLGIERRDIDAEEIVERCIYALVLEGARILEEGIAVRSSDIDVVWANGYGFPRYRGGPMFYADTVGVEKVYAKICEFRDRYGAQYWEPNKLLERLAREGGRFSDLDK